MEDQKRRQVDYHEREHYNRLRPRIPDNSHPYIEWLNTYRLAKAERMMRTTVAGKTMLSVCAGDGEEAAFFQSKGAHVTIVDLSREALAAAQVRNPKLICVCMDAESLTFPDQSFDWVLVRDGLHHLARPLKGFYEAERVCREGFIILEGQDSLPVRLLAQIGVAENWDPAGGYVYRFTRRELHKVFSSMQTVQDWEVHTAWLPFGSDILTHVPPFRRWVYPLMNLAAVRTLLMAAPVKAGAKSLFGVATGALGRWGNSLIVVAHKKR